MFIRQGLNFAVHLVAGIAFGALTVAAATRCLRRDEDAEDMDLGPTPPPAAEPPPPGAGPAPS